jgi:PAS domain S-box-containing protein
MNALNADNVLSEEKLCTSLVNSLRGIVWESDPDTFRFFYVSPRAEDILGFPAQQWLDEPDFWRAHTHPDDVEWCAAYCHNAAAKQEDHDFQYRMIAADGQIVWLHDVVTVVGLDDGTVRLRGIMIDITEQKQTEERLRSSEERFQLALQGASDGLWDWNLLTDEVYFSPRWKSMLGYAEDELEHHLDTWKKLVHPEDREPTLALVRDFAAGRVGKYETEFRLRHRDGHYLTILSRAFLSRDAQGRAVRMVGTHLDITGRKKLEKALLDSEEQFRTLCDFAPIGIFRTDGEGNNIYCNPRWEEITGLTAAEGLGRGWLRGIHPEDRERLGEVWREAMAGGRIYSHEHRQLTPKGRTLWVHALASPIKRTDGKIIGYVGTVEDITEIQQARQEMLKAQKLESLGLMAGGIAHDFNNILTSILGNVSLARLQLDDPEKVSARLESAEKAAARARDLTQQLLTFSKGGEPIKKTIAIRGLLKEAAEFALHGSNVRGEFTLADDLWPVEADEGQLSQVIHNLVLNAVQAMPDGGTVTIRAENAVSRRKEERFVRISVADTGVGVPEQYLQKIFDPYFTTKQQGSGLGLATCYSIIRKHGGKIRAASTLGKGSTFYLSLPAAQRECESGPSAESSVSPGSGRILVMDDEEVVREITKAMLEESGYLVECAHDGAGAVELYRQRKEQGTPFDAVIMDLTIPGGVGGKEAINQLLAIDPDVRAIVSSGYSNDPIMANYRQYGFRAILAKPYRMQELNAALLELLRS